MPEDWDIGIDFDEEELLVFVQNKSYVFFERRHWPEIRDYIDQALKLRAPDGRRILQLRCGHCGKTFPMGGGHRCNVFRPEGEA